MQLADAIRPANPAMLTVSLRRQLPGQKRGREGLLEFTARDRENHPAEYCRLSHRLRNRHHRLHGARII
jgi:hypothetical protein